MSAHDAHFFPTPHRISGGIAAAMKGLGGAVIEAAGSTIATKAYVLPALWSEYLLRGDTGSFHLDDERELLMVNMIEDWLAEKSLDACVEVRGEPFFSWTNDGPMSLACNCRTFVFTTQA